VKCRTEVHFRRLNLSNYRLVIMLEELHKWTNPGPWARNYGIQQVHETEENVPGLWRHIFGSLPSRKLCMENCHLGHGLVQLSKLSVWPIAFVDLFGGGKEAKIRNDVACLSWYAWCITVLTHLAQSRLFKIRRSTDD
jgi:hypothetical protein